MNNRDKVNKENILKVYIDKINNYIIPLFKTIILLFLIGLIIFAVFSWNFEKSDKIFHFLEASLWPIIAILFIFLFKNEISTMLIKGFLIVFPSGHEVRTGEAVPKQEGQQNDPPSKNIESYKKVEKEIKEKIEHDKDIEKLKNDLINTQIYLDFERIYRIIFGSQIEMLKRLRSYSPSGEQSNNIILFFVFTQRITPALSNWTFNQYLNFLLINNLIYFDNNYYFISDKGKAFLAYIEFLNFPIKNL